jgi:hypothetical protein
MKEEKDNLYQEHEHLKEIAKNVCKGESDIPYEYLAERLLKEIEIMDGQLSAIKFEMEDLSRKFGFNAPPL